MTGYQSGAEIDLAVERGELHCRAFDLGSFIAREPTRTWFKTGVVKSLIQTGTGNGIIDCLKSPNALRAHGPVQDLRAEPAHDHGDPRRRRLRRPMVAPPGLSPDLARALREAYAKTLRDPDFVGEVKKRQYDLDPVSAEEMQTWHGKWSTNRRK